MTTDIQTFALHKGDEFVELYKVLKVQGMVNGGGDAKHVITEGRVTVNGDVDTRKRKKCVVGDIISFNGATVKIVPAQ